MLDSLYRDIGKKIKSWAKWIFIVEAIGAVITGVSILINGGEVVLALLTIVLGPCVALVSTWLLYAAGEAVDKICEIERNTRPAGRDAHFPSASVPSPVAAAPKAEAIQPDAVPKEKAIDTAWEPTADEIYKLDLYVKVAFNFLFNKYDVELLLDDRSVCTIPHGTAKTIRIPVSPGEHTLTFAGCNTHADSNRQTITIETDTKNAYYIECFNDKVRICNPLFDNEDL